jgi:predicted Zn-dependent protease
LEQAAAKWRWQKEAEDLLWLLGKDPEKQSAALAALYQDYAEKGDTSDLYRVLARLCEIKPDDEKAQNNFAQLSLLLNLNVEHAHDLAEQLYKKDPKNPVFASTYGFSLYRKGRYQQAVKVMSDLEPADLQNPTIAAYYGVFLVAAGDKSKAAEYLERGSEASLLPEEKALLQDARNKN